MKRFIALLLVLIPISSAAFGVKFMRDAIFGEPVFIFTNISLQFVAGIFLFIFGLYIMGSFVYYRDKKRNKIPMKSRK